MTATLLIEQVLNGLQFGVMLFLMAAGLTLVFGVMGLINLAHGSLYMVGAFACAAVAAATGSFLLSLAAALAAAAAAGAIVEVAVIRRLYDRDHLDQVLATFALILVFSEGTRWLFGSFPLYLDVPAALAGSVHLPGGLSYPTYRLAIIAVGLAVAAGLFLLINRTRLGVRIRAGEADREMIAALGVDISRLYTIVFALGAALAGLAGALIGPIQSVQVGMGEPVLIMAFVVVVIGGIGSIKGALVGAILVGLTDTSLYLRNTLRGVNTMDAWSFFLIAFALLLVVLGIVATIVRSRFGLALDMARQNPLRLTSVGVRPFDVRLTAFVISAMIVGLAGALYADLNRFVSPTMLSWHLSGELIVFIILGGVGRLCGPVAGAALYILLEHQLGQVTEYWQFLLGILLLLVVLFARGGLIGLVAGRRSHA